MSAGTFRRVRLELPEPPRQGGGRSRHWWGAWAKLNRYKANCWAMAIQQHRPSVAPPDRVRIDLHYRLWALRDLPNPYVDAKPVLDALKKRHPTKDRLTWRNGVWPDRGYFADDSAVQFGTVTQEIDRSNRGLTVLLESSG